MPPTFKTDADRLWHRFRTIARIHENFHRFHQPEVRLYRPIDLVKALNAVGISPMMVGCFGCGLWRHEPQMEGDVDVLVGFRQFAFAADTVGTKFPRLERLEKKDSVAFHDPKSRWTSAVYHVHRSSTPLMKKAFRHRLLIEKGRFYGPDLEWSIASLFERSKLAVEQRDMGRRFLALGDMLSVATNPTVEVEHEKLEELAELVGPRAYKEIMVEVNKCLAQVVDPQAHN